MNVFDTHAKIVGDYARYIRSFINIADPAIRQTVDAALAEGKLWPEPLLQFNPAYEMAGSVAEIVRTGALHGATTDIFKGYSLYRHQLEAIRLGIASQDFVVTSGTGSGKSLTYIGSIFHRLLTSPQSSGVTAVVVYPMNALINSQTNEFRIYKENYEHATRNSFPITFGQYTGQEREEVRDKLREHPPQVLLTNYMMLELLLTRVRERPIRDAIYGNLRYLVFDELHTYRGRQGADVAMLIRRIAAQCKQQYAGLALLRPCSGVRSALNRWSPRRSTAHLSTRVRFPPAQLLARRSVPESTPDTTRRSSGHTRLPSGSKTASRWRSARAASYAAGHCGSVRSSLRSRRTQGQRATSEQRVTLHDPSFQAAPVHSPDRCRLHDAGSRREPFHHSRARNL